jgi:sugar-specific transcriptional regulator TrmB
MIDQITDIFRLEKKETEVFLRLYELGPQPASVIAKNTGIQRNSTRFILDNLVAMGIATKSAKANTQIYEVESKENIIRTLEIQKANMLKEIDTKIQVINKVGDELDNRFKSKNVPKVKFYEGVAGIEKVYEDTLSARGEIRSWASFDGMHEGLPSYFNTYYKRRAGNNVAIRSIHPDTEFAKQKTKNDSKELRKSKLVDAKKYNWVPEIQVYDDKINIVSWNEKIGIIIESEGIAEALKTIFEISWDQLPPKK